MKIPPGLIKCTNFFGGNCSFKYFMISQSWVLSVVVLLDVILYVVVFHLPCYFVVVLLQWLPILQYSKLYVVVLCICWCRVFQWDELFCWLSSSFCCTFSWMFSSSTSIIHQSPYLALSLDKCPCCHFPMLLHIFFLHKSYRNII